MIKREIKLSADFKTQTSKAITSIIFFALTYILMLVLSVGLTAFCVYAGILLIALYPTFLTIALGIGLTSLGILVLIFLLKFIFNSNKVDRSHLFEIRKENEPELFALIEEIVVKVGTSFPKKVYLSTDVNAAVFYDSNFWSMFFPVKKNLQIGLGLVNTVTQDELTAILSHEFGHFSQKTMKVGSYVYNVNKVIFNLLYDNESYNKLIQSWANVSGYFSIFVILAVKIVECIQWVLRSMYSIVNKSYMGLSREMEFHADEIAASVTGFEPLKSSLLRMALADHSFNNVLRFYDGKIAENQKSMNLYKEHFFVMNFLAEDNNISIVNNFPQVSMDELNKFNKSKLVINNQWASHPSNEERIERLEKTNYISEQTTHFPAGEIFNDIEEIQIELTNRIFKDINYSSEVSLLSYEEFQAEYSNEFLSNSFSKVYNGYYDNKNPLYFDITSVDSINENIKFEELFSDQKIDLVYTSIALQNDIEILKQIAEKIIPIKTFDYDGNKYKRKESKNLLTKLGLELEHVNKQIVQNDITIFQYFSKSELSNHKLPQLKNLYNDFFAFDKDFDSKNETYTVLSNELQFMNFPTPSEQIIANFKKIVPLEKKLKNDIKALLDDRNYQKEITKEIRDNFELFISKEWSYFSNDIYLDSNLQILFTAMNSYVFLLSRGYYLRKKKLMDYQDEIIITTHNSENALPNDFLKSELKIL